MRVLVTRATSDAGPLASGLQELGHDVVRVPVLELRFRPDAVAAAAAAHPHADVLVVTSAVGADALAVGAPSAWRSVRVAAVGPGTAQRLRSLGYTVSVMPERATASDLVAALGELTGLVVVHPRGDLAADATATALRARGAVVVDPVAYENLPPTGYGDQLLRALPVDATTLFSGSAAERVAAAVPVDRRAELGRILVVGPSTATAAAAAGLTVAQVAAPHTVAGMLDLFRGRA